MSLETGSRIADLVATNPVGATDFVSQGDDHIRLIKACVQGSFPALGATAVSVTAEKLNFTAGLTSDAQTQLDARQPLDTDLSAIAALTTTSHGRAFLTLADAAASRAHIGAQADDADLTAIAALTTTTYGRDFLALADNAALATKIAAMAQVWTGTHSFRGVAELGVSVSGASLGLRSGFPAFELLDSAGPVNARRWEWIAPGSGNLHMSAQNDAGSASSDWMKVYRSGVAIAAMEYGNSTDLPPHTFYGGVFAPTLTSTAGLEYGKLCFTASNGTIPNGVGNQWMLILINGGSPVTFTKPTGSTTYLSSLGVTCSTFTVAAHGMCLVVAGGSTLHFVSGDIVSYT